MKRIKLLLTTIAVTAAMAAPVLADSHIMDLGVTSGGMYVTIPSVVSTVDGTLMIYDYSVGSQGDLLGDAPINVGANADVRVQLSMRPQGNLLAVLTDGSGAPVAQSVIDLP